VIMSCYFFGMVWLYRIGYLTLARGFTVGMSYLYSWILIISYKELVLGSVALACSTHEKSMIGTLVFCPMAFVLDKKPQTWSCILLMVTNIVLVFFYVCFMAPTKAITIEPAEVQRKLVIMVLLLTTSLAIKMYFHTVFYAVHDDVVSANERIAASTKEKDDFFTTITHEIRNPLQSLVLSVELLQERMDSTLFGKLLEISKNCSELILNLVSNILDMSKIGAGKMALSLSLVDVREMVKKIMRISETRVAAKGIAIRLLDCPQLPPALALDPQRLNQIILNIVSNAIKFTNKGEVVIKLQWIPVAEGDSSPRHLRRTLRDTLSRSSWQETLAFAEPDNGELTARLERYQIDVPPSVHRRCTSHTCRVSPDTPPVIRGRYKLGIVKIEVMDTGIGISKEGRARLFKPYQQANERISQYVYRRWVGTMEGQDWDCG
jgi:signal transduction histidine kinase